MASGSVKKSTVDRYCMVVMAGIAGEALEYGKAEGGASDEQAVVQFLGSISSPPWGIDRIRDQARWGVVQSVMLLKVSLLTSHSNAATDPTRTRPPTSTSTPDLTPHRDIERNQL